MISRFMINERTSRRTWTGIALSVVGIVVVMSDSFGGGNMGGDVLALVAITAFAMNLTIWRRFPTQSRPMAMALAGMFMAVVAVGPADVFGHDRNTFVLLVLMGVVTGPAGRVALASSTRYLPAAEVGLFSPVETIAAITWAWLAFGETPSRAAGIGGAIVLAALVYATKPRAKVGTVS